MTDPVGRSGPDSVTLPAYDLPDCRLQAGQVPGEAVWVWRPTEVGVVLGRANRPESSLFLDRVAADGVPVRQRLTGGEAVVLTPRTLCLSIQLVGESLPLSSDVFVACNGRVQAALGRLGVGGVTPRGISDLAINERKVLGSSMYRSRTRVFYHAVLNLAEPPDLMARYLRFPARQPDYRLGRSHAAFVTSLAAEGHPVSVEELMATLEGEFPCPLMELFPQPGRMGR